MNCCWKRKLDLLNEVNYINFDRDYECVIKLCVKLMTVESQSGYSGVNYETCAVKYYQNCIILIPNT